MGPCFHQSRHDYVTHTGGGSVSWPRVYGAPARGGIKSNLLLCISALVNNESPKFQTGVGEIEKNVTVPQEDSTSPVQFMHLHENEGSLYTAVVYYLSWTAL